MNSIHSACGAAFARHRGKIGTLHLLQEEIYRIEKQVDAVCILKMSILNFKEILIYLIQIDRSFVRTHFTITNVINNVYAICNNTVLLFPSLKFFQTCFIVYIIYYVFMIINKKMYNFHVQFNSI